MDFDESVGYEKEDIFSVFSAEEQEQLIALLTKLNAHLTDLARNEALCRHPHPIS